MRIVEGVCLAVAPRRCGRPDSSCRTCTRIVVDSAHSPVWQVQRRCAACVGRIDDQPPITAARPERRIDAVTCSRRCRQRLVSARRIVARAESGRR